MIVINKQYHRYAPKLYVWTGIRYKHAEYYPEIIYEDIVETAFFCIDKKLKYILIENENVR